MSVADVDWVLQVVRRVMAVDGYSSPERPKGAILVHGRLMVEPSVAIDEVSAPLQEAGYLALLDRRDNTDYLTLMPHRSPAHRSRPLLALSLLVLTLASVMFVGGMMEYPELEELLQHPFSGWPFALSLLAILGTHEMGHYLVARRNGVQVSLPYFIPMPIGPLGTMGAFINMRSVPRNRSQVLRVGLAGPLSGLVVALPVLAYGLSISTVGAIPAGYSYLQEGNSVLYLLLKRLILGAWLPSGGVDVSLSSVAFAGWAGLMVTGLNLIPAAQLDGGHVAFALLGRRAATLTMVLAAAMLLLGFTWEGWFLWAVMVFLLGSRQQVVQDAISPLSAREKWVACLALLLAALLFTPVPLAVVQT